MFRVEKEKRKWNVHFAVRGILLVMGLWCMVATIVAIVQVSEISPEIEDLNDKYASFVETTSSLNLTCQSSNSAVSARLSSALAAIGGIQTSLSGYANKTIVEARFSNLTSSVALAQRYVTNVASVLDAANITNLATISQVSSGVQSLNNSFNTVLQGLSSLNSSMIVSQNVSTASIQALGSYVSTLNASTSSTASTVSGLLVTTSNLGTGLVSVNVTLNNVIAKSNNGQFRNLTAYYTSSGSLPSFNATAWAGGLLVNTYNSGVTCANGPYQVNPPPASAMIPYFGSAGSLNTYYWNWSSCALSLIIPAGLGYDGYYNNITIPPFSATQFTVIKVDMPGYSTRLGIFNGL